MTLKIKESTLRNFIRKSLFENENKEDVDSSETSLSKTFSTEKHNFTITVDGKSGDANVEIESKDPKLKVKKSVPFKIKDGDNSNKFFADIIAGIGYKNEGSKEVLEDLAKITKLVNQINPEYLVTKMAPRSHRARFDAYISKIT